MPTLGNGIRPGTTIDTVSDGMILGGMAHGTDIAVCIVLGTTVGTILGTTDGTILGTTDGTTHTGVHGDGTITDTTVTIVRGIIHIAITMDIRTTMVAVVAAVTTTAILGAPEQFACEQYARAC